MISFLKDTVVYTMLGLLLLTISSVFAGIGIMVYNTLEKSYEPGVALFGAALVFCLFAAISAAVIKRISSE